MSHVSSLFNITKSSLDMNNTSSNSHSDDCKLFNTFGILIQGLLLVISLLFLAFKKNFDKHKRTWLVWSLDISKLIFCQTTQHFINLFYSYEIGEDSGLECEWYLINLITDCTINVLFQWVFFEIVSYLLKDTRYELHSGHYYNEQGLFDISFYLYQLSIWISIVIISKLITISIFFIFARVMKKIASAILSSLKDKPKLKLLVVMIIVPGILNCLQYWFTDNFIKDHDGEAKEASQSKEGSVDEKDKLII